MVGPGGIREDIERYGSTINAMLDETTCSHEDLPCDRPNGKSYGAEGQMSGLSSFDVWWRPART
ncbi:hypothetical protein BDZ45DRAFT_673201 [Acephala macrosclerotiorum]|nr:hypothetical protein BDZ45DRAFT_673201 [Acephala macrosclerotiorum]